MVNMNFMGFPITVVFTDDLPEGEYGHCRAEEGRIYVSKSLMGSHREAVVFHELAHFLWSKACAGRKKVSEEEFCTLCELFATLGLDK
jgi:hypothetical protein